MSDVDVKAAFQGERGAFSEQAARQLLGPKVEVVPQKTFAAMFEAVVSGAADCAMAPIENTLAGSIIQNYDLLLEHDLAIVGEVVLRIVHNLIAPPGVRLEDVRSIYSQPPAIAQCERFLATRPEVQVIAAYDTAGSVKLVMENGRRDEAAIAGRAAAEAWGGAIIAAGIETNQQNFTRFFLLVRPDRAAEISPLVRGGERKTSIVYRVGNKPGALYRSLAAFADAHIDLTKIESRPIEGRPWEYSFYLDFLGDRADPPVQRALAKLAEQAENLRILGSYPRADF